VKFLTLVVLAGTLASARPQSPGSLSLGTIMMAVLRPQFVVLGADRQRHRDDGSGRPVPEGTNPKFALHDTFPLAVVHGGLAELRVPGSRLANVNDLVKGAMRAVSADQLDPDNPGPLARVFDSILSSFVRETRAAYREDLRRRSVVPPASEDIMSEANLKLLAGFVARDRACLMQIVIDDVVRTSVVPGDLAAPHELATFYSTGPYTEDARVFGDGINDPRGLADHIKAVIEAGFAEEARMNGGRNIKVGGGVDVVLVNRAGARLVPSGASGASWH
jgi:hypothetical protein